MADEGIDALVGGVDEGGIVYQVKWSSKVEQNPDQWLESTIVAERPKIERLIRERHITGYVLMTSVAGTTTSTGTGSVQKLERELEKFSKEFGIPVSCWWQADVDAAVDLAPDGLKWAYPEMLAGVNAIRYLMHASQTGAQAEKMRDTILKVMATQADEDSKIKFSQVDLDQVPLVDLFVDVQATLVSLPQNAIEAFHSTQNDEVHGTAGAAQHLLETKMPLTYILGVPGQGKSTLGQYLAQIHRAAILPDDLYEESIRPPESVGEPKLPLRVDLKDYGAWISGIDPFGDDDAKGKTRTLAKAKRSLEQFLSHFCEVMSGGRSTSVEEVQSLLDRYPTLLVLDGLDEVADPDLRKIVVDEINATCVRLAAGASKAIRQFQVLVTARPNASNLAEPDPDTFQTLQLQPLAPELQDGYVKKWCRVNGVEGRKRRELQRTFHDRTRLDHVAQLADNPMQLTILLTLIKRKGDAVPVSRTPLYTEYMKTLMEREVDRQQIQRDQVGIVEEVTAFLGCHMHSRVETSPRAGRMTQHDILTTLLLYFHLTENPGQNPQHLFQAASDRFWALTSKVEGTFEFVVQPVREYFAARFLAHWAARERRVPLSKEEVLKELVNRTYWLNTARFYAGFSQQNEIASLRYGIEEAIASRRHPLQTRSAAWILLADGIFVDLPRVQADVVRLLSDDLTAILAGLAPNSHVLFPMLAPATGVTRWLPSCWTVSVQIRANRSQPRKPAYSAASCSGTRTH